MAGGFSRPEASVSLSPDGTLLATGTDGGRVRIWRVRDGALLHTFQNDWSYSGHVEFTRDGSMVVGEGVLNKTSNRGLKFWRVSDGVRTTFLPAAGVRTFTLSPMGTSQPQDPTLESKFDGFQMGRFCSPGLPTLLVVVFTHCPFPRTGGSWHQEDRITTLRKRSKYGMWPTVHWSAL